MAFTLLVLIAALLSELGNADIIPCNSTVCENSGICLFNTNTSAYCSCPPTYTGNKCQTATGYKSLTNRCTINAISYGTPSSVAVIPGELLPVSGYVDLNGVRTFVASIGYRYYEQRRGVNVLVIDPVSCTVSEFRNFDTHHNFGNATALSNYINQLSSGSVIIGVSCDEPYGDKYFVPENHLVNAYVAFGNIGVDVTDVGFRHNFVFFAIVGQPSKTVLKKSLSNASTASLHSEIFIVLTADPCDSSPCQNGGTCSSEISTCQCSPTYTGNVLSASGRNATINTCSTVDSCSNSPCHSGGTCISDSSPTYTCQCAPGYTGTNCQTGSTNSETNFSTKIGIVIGASGGVAFLIVIIILLCILIYCCCRREKKANCWKTQQTATDGGSSGDTENRSNTNSGSTYEGLQPEYITVYENE